MALELEDLEQLHDLHFCAGALGRQSCQAPACGLMGRRNMLSKSCSKNWPLQKREGSPLGVNLKKSSGGQVQQTTNCQGHTLLECGKVCMEDYDLFRLALGERMAQGDKKVKKHRTPGYIQACVMDALIHMEVLRARRSEDSTAGDCPCRDPCGGFTDVGTHTGCLPRYTTWPLVREIIQFLLIRSTGPEGGPKGEEAMHSFFRLALLHFELWLLMRQAALVNTTSATPKMLDACMVMLTSISKKAADLSDDGHDVSKVEECMEVVRSHLLAEQGNRAGAAGQWFQISKWPGTGDAVLQNSDEGSMRLPSGHLPSPPMQDAVAENGFGLAKLRCLTNLGSLSLLPEGATIEEMLAWVKLPQWTENEGRDAVAGQLVLRGVERQMFRWAKNGFHGRGDVLPAAPTVVNVLEEYRGHVSRFMDSPACQATMLVELRSREILVIWVATCLTHKDCCQQHPITSRYGIGLDWLALEHLVLFNREAVDAALSVSAYVKENTQLHKSLFSLVDGARIEAYWTEVKRKQQLASDLRRKIREEECSLAEIRGRHGVTANLLLSISKRHSRDAYDRAARKSNLISGELASCQVRILGLRGQLTEAEKAPPPVIQPLPQDLVLAHRWLFFLYMPLSFRLLSQATFLAQQALLPYPRSSVREETVVGAYTTQVVNHYRVYQKSIYHTPASNRTGEAGRVELWTRTGAPTDVGPKYVDSLSCKADGVWYPDRLAVEMCWAGSGSQHDRIEGLHSPFNPFAYIKPAKKIESFTERLQGTSKTLQWCLPTYGTVNGTDPKRGNWAVASQDERGSLSKPGYLALGTLRSYSFGQYRRLCAALCQRSFPLDHPAVRTTVMQAMYHLGTLYPTADGHVGLKWRAYWDEPNDVLSNLTIELDRLAVELEDTPREHDSVLLLGTIAAYLSAWHRPCILTARRFVSMVSNAAGHLDGSIKEAELACEDRVQQGLRERQNHLRKVSLLCYASGPFDDEHEAADAAHMIELMVLINHGCIFMEEQSEESKRESVHLHVRCQNVMALSVDVLMEAVKSCPGYLTDAVSLVLPPLPETLEWRQLGPHASFEAEGADGHLYSINILDGTVLLDGSPPSRLPRDIVTHNMYR
eukprot:gene27659-7297_t